MEKENDMPTGALRQLMIEQDKRYEQRFLEQDKARDTAFSASKTAIETAIKAQTTAMETAFVSAEKVSNKTEHNTEDKFKSVDTILEQVRLQAMTFVPRQEWSITVDNFAASIKKLEEHQYQNTGAENYSTKNKSQNNWVIGVIIASAAAIISLIVAFTHIIK